MKAVRSGLVLVFHARHKQLSLSLSIKIRLRRPVVTNNRRAKSFNGWFVGGIGSGKIVKKGESSNGGAFSFLNLTFGAYICTFVPKARSPASPRPGTI